MVKHMDIKIYGQVQGVNFRYESLRQAKQRRISGLVRNEPDGSVYIEAEGSGEDVEKFLAWCRQGPVSAAVEKVEAQEGKLKGYSGFVIAG
jgi:acylphosphatase